MDSNYMLSIYVATYNQENYIKIALDSIFMQKTKYSFEILVGEDCSTDGTRQVLKEYESAHAEDVRSGKLKIFYRDHNMNGRNHEDLKSRSTGKYIIALEGDDYWIDEDKIEKQIAFLESHPDYIAVAHNCVIVDENGIPTGEVYQECKQPEYTFAHYMSEIMPGQTATIMYKNIFRDNTIDISLLRKNLVPGDRLNYIVLLCNGKIYCMQECMSAYRHVTTHGNSFSATYRYCFETERKWNREVLLYLKTKPNYSKYGDMLMVRCIMTGLRSRQCSLRMAFQCMKSVDRKFYALAMWFVCKFRQHICHQEMWMS